MWLWAAFTPAMAYMAGRFPPGESAWPRWIIPHVLGTISLTMWEEGGSYGAVAALGVIQIVPLAIIVAGLRAVELRIQRRAQAQQS